MRGALRAIPLVLVGLLASACGGPPPKPAPPPELAPPPVATPPAPVMQQELGSIDDGAVEQQFVELAGPLEACHAAGRARVAVLAGDITVFLRIDAKGRARYDYLEASTLGDRDTERCILDLLAGTTWPAPTGGEAEVRHSLGWDAGSERPPTPWESEKVSFAIDASASTRHAIDQCKRGASGTLTLTGYVTTGAPMPAASAAIKKSGTKKSHKKPKKTKVAKEGHFRALGGASSSKDGADKVDCAIAAVRELALPSPGSATTKVSFAL